jgi:hypothetical protein
VVTPAGAGGIFASVSCSDASDCTAVGIDEDSPTFAARPFYATESAGTWGAAIIVGGPGTQGAFYSVSCSDPTDCTAVGGAGPNVLSGKYTGAIAATDSGGTWGSFAVVPRANGLDLGDLVTVSCWSATNCTAVGDSGHDRPVFSTDTAGTWSPLVKTEAKGNAVVSVSCAAAETCTAVGYGHQHPAEAHYDAMYVTESNS